MDYVRYFRYFVDFVRIRWIRIIFARQLCDRKASESGHIVSKRCFIHFCKINEHRDDVIMLSNIFTIYLIFIFYIFNVLVFLRGLPTPLNILISAVSSIIEVISSSLTERVSMLLSLLSIEILLCTLFIIFSISADGL